MSISKSICVCAKSLQLCPALCDPPGSAVHRILQARTLEWVAVLFSRGSSWPRDRTHLLCLLHWQAGSLLIASPGKSLNPSVAVFRVRKWLGFKWGHGEGFLGGASGKEPATWWEKLTYWKKPWCWERLKAGGEGDDRGWDGGMASATRWTWVWVNSGSWWWTGSPGMLQFMGSQRVRHDWVTELNW